jgi:hypothetical protein
MHPRVVLAVRDQRRRSRPVGVVERIADELRRRLRRIIRD